MIDLIIFDLDGVLVDTEHIHYGALCRSINEITDLSYDEIRKSIRTDGSTTKSKLKILKSIYDFTDDICNQINTLKQESALKEFVHLTPNINQIKMLSTLSKKYKLAIGSNSRKANVDAIINAINIRNFFSSIISIDDINIEKPDPAIFNHIMNSLKTDKTRTLILEDSPRGIEAAQRTGAHVLTTSIDLITLEYIENAIREIETNDYCSDGRLRI